MKAKKADLKKQTFCLLFSPLLFFSSWSVVTITQSNTLSTFLDLRPFGGYHFWPSGSSSCVFFFSLCVFLFYLCVFDAFLSLCFFCFCVFSPWFLDFFCYFLESEVQTSDTETSFGLNGKRISKLAWSRIDMAAFEAGTPGCTCSVVIVDSVVGRLLLK